jgi:hypothetical protein
LIQSILQKIPQQAYFKKGAVEMKVTQEQRETLKYGAFAGLTVGIFLAAITSWSQISEEPKGILQNWVLLPLVLTILGAFLPFIATHLIQAFRQLLTPLGITSVEVKLPGLGQVKLELGNPQRAAARRIFLEMTTRTVTQPLGEEDGTLSAAVSSLYSFFQIVREELKTMPPTPPGTDPNAVTLESIAHRMINQGLRPYTSRWHPRLDAWNETGFGETDWPLHEICRHDLNRMRAISIQYAESLAKAAGIPAKDALIPQNPFPKLADSEIEPDHKKEFERIDKCLNSAASAEHRQVSWKLATEFRAVAAKINLHISNPEVLTELDEVLYKLAGNLCWNLGNVVPTPGDNDLDEIGHIVLEEIGNYRQKILKDAPPEAEKILLWLKNRAIDFESISRTGVSCEKDDLDDAGKKVLKEIEQYRRMLLRKDPSKANENLKKLYDIARELKLISK